MPSKAALARKPMPPELEAAVKKLEARIKDLRKELGPLEALRGVNNAIEKRKDELDHFIEQKRAAQEWIEEHKDAARLDANEVVSKAAELASKEMRAANEHLEEAKLEAEQARLFAKRQEDDAKKRIEEAGAIEQELLQREHDLSGREETNKAKADQLTITELDLQDEQRKIDQSRKTLGDQQALNDGIRQDLDHRCATIALAEEEINEKFRLAESAVDESKNLYQEARNAKTNAETIMAKAESDARVASQAVVEAEQAQAAIRKSRAELAGKENQLRSANNELDIKQSRILRREASVELAERGIEKAHDDIRAEWQKIELIKRQLEQANAKSGR